jgi:hypothetical protein
MPAGIPTATPFDALVAQRFKIEIGGVSIASFQEVSGITSEIEVVELKANDALGKPILKKMIGATKPPTITLAGRGSSMEPERFRPPSRRRSTRRAPSLIDPSTAMSCYLLRRLGLQAHRIGDEGRRQRPGRRGGHDRLRAARAGEVTWPLT